MNNKIYGTWDDVPDGLATKTMLAKQNKKPAPGQQPVAYKRNHNRGGSDYELYEIDQATDKTPPTPAQLAALEKAREQAALNSRCANCGSSFDYMARGRVQIEDTGNGGYICFICHDRSKAATWARLTLATPGSLILDTETTGLGDKDQIVEIAIINITGETVFNSLIRPTIPIPLAASRIHGITDEDVAGADTWAEIDEQVRDLLANAPAVIIYNAAYDTRMIYQTRLAHELTPDPNCLIIPGAKFQCAMMIYARWYGDWSDYHKSYKWQRLDGGHRALGDCLATLEKLKEMANETD